tara:strand:+ start:182 stop:2017 length:1836 start_codon:yes stop_codon:yes gene_type:complete
VIFIKPKCVFVNITVSLAVLYTIFISSPLWAADENSSIDEQLAHADEIRSSQPKLFLTLVNELNQNTTNLSASQQDTLNYLNLYLLIYQENLAEAIISAKALINSDADMSLKFRARISLLNIYANSQQWTEGLATVSNVLTDLPLIKNEKTYHFALLVTALFYNQLGQYDLSLHYAKKVESSSKEGREQCLAKSQIIKSLLELKQLTPTDPIIKHAISLCRINKEHLIIGLIYSYMTKMHLENQQQDEALQLLESTLQEALNTKYPRIIAEYYSLFAQAYWLNNNADLTKKFAIEALNNEKEEGTTDAKILSYKLLYEVYNEQKNYELALLYHRKYAIADKLHYNETQKKYLAFQLAEHQAIEQQNKIDLLNKENALLTSEKALLTAEKAMTRSNIQNNRLVITILILAISVLTFWGYHLLKAHKRIKELAEYDSLTGIFNRGHFTHIADTTLEYCKSASQNLSLIMFDLDQFKDVNDNYGHACGDWVLKKAAEVCKKLGRQNDIFARIGGEEFCILLSSCDMQSAEQRAEACRKAIAEINTTASGFDFTITASFGVTDTKTSGYDLGKLLADADNAAYASKDAGRNKVTLFKPKTVEQEVGKLDSSLNAF